jgi:acyl carrier protein
MDQVSISKKVYLCSEPPLPTNSSAETFLKDCGKFIDKGNLSSHPIYGCELLGNFTTYSRKDAIMTRDELLGKIADIFGVEVSSLHDESCVENTEGWDSMADLGIIALLDELGNSTIETDDISQLKSIGAIVKFAKERGIVES